jgi:hypothetical protein
MDFYQKDALQFPQYSVKFQLVQFLRTDQRTIQQIVKSFDFDGRDVFFGNIEGITKKEFNAFVERGKKDYDRVMRRFKKYQWRGYTLKSISSRETAYSDVTETKLIDSNTSIEDTLLRLTK